MNTIGDISAATIPAIVGELGRFRSAGHFAAYNGTAPIEASSGDVKRHWLSRRGNRRLNSQIHIVAVVQLARATDGRAYYERKIAEGKSRMEALRALKRHISNAVYRRLVADAREREAAREGQVGTSIDLAV
jgi:transposase